MQGPSGTWKRVGRWVVIFWTMSSGAVPRMERTGPVIPRSDYERIASVARIEHGADYEVPHYDAGSGFIKVPAAWLLDQCGLKGLVAGNAGIYEKQPLVIVNLTGNASPSEILAVEAMAVKAVYEKFGVTLHPEVEHV